MTAVAMESGGGVEPRLLRGDLEAIVAKALSRDPDKRYPDVAAFEADLDRYRAHHPVQARSRTAGYVLARFLSRHRIAAGLLLIFSMATAISLLLFAEARRQRAAAEARFEEVRSLAKYQLFTLYDQLAAVPGSIAARARLSEEAQRYLDRLAAQPGAPRSLKVETAIGYNRLAEIQGVPNRPNLGRSREAQRNLARAAALIAPLLAADPADKAAARALARTRLLQADIAIWQENDTELGARILALAEPLVATGRDSALEWLELEALRRGVRLDMLGWSERYEEERALATETLRWIDALPPALQASAFAVVARAEALGARAEAAWYLGDRQASLADAEAADALVSSALGRSPDDPALLAARVVTGYNLVTTLEPLGRTEGLLARAREIVATGQRLQSLEPHDRLLAARMRNARSLLAQLLVLEGRQDEALAVQAEVVAADAQRLAAAPGDARAARDLGFSRRVLGSLHFDSGSRTRGCAEWRAAEQALTQLEAAGRLNAWDRSNLLATLRSDLEKCAGA